MMGLHFMRTEPFYTVYIHALVRDEKGQKMSKSKGNVLDPLELIDKYGGDTLRFTLTAMAAQGRDIKLSTGRVEGYRNFITKLWNAARFCEMNECRPVAGFDAFACTLNLNRWIAGEVAEAAREVDAALAAYRFNDAANAIYQFTWGTYCDWYLELAKPALTGADGAAKDETRATAAWALDQILLLLHPIAPFVTEELWGGMGAERPSLLIEAPWPAYPADAVDWKARAELRFVRELISEIRSISSELNVPPKSKPPLLTGDIFDESRTWLAAHDEAIRRLARIGLIEAVDGAPPKGAVHLLVSDALGSATFFLPLAEVIDLEAEKARIEKRIAKLDQEIGKYDRKLADEKFTSRAPEHVIEEQHERRGGVQLDRDRLADALKHLMEALKG